MLGVYVCLGNQRTSRFELARTQVKIGSNDQNDLVLRDGGVASFHCTITLEDGIWSVSFRGAAVRVNGRAVESPYPLADRDRIAIGAYNVVLALALRGARPATQPVERDLVSAVELGDDAAVMVYADWLEERGDRFRSEFLRVQQVAFAEGTNANDRQIQLQRWRLRELATHIDIVWRQRVGRGEITGCVNPNHDCPGDWSRLAPTDDPRIRRCATCRRSVFYCRTHPEARACNDSGCPSVIDIRDFGVWYPGSWL